MIKVAIITGASGGLGSALSLALLKNEWRVVAGARTPENAEVLLQYKNLYGDQLEIVQADVTKADDLIQLKEQAMHMGNLALLINNAGTANGKSLEEATMEEFEEVFRVNVSSAFALTKLCLPELKENKGAIVNISSLVGRVALPYLGIYSASKHALGAMTASMHLENIQTSLKFRLIEPGPLDSKLCGDAIAQPADHTQKEGQLSMRTATRNIAKSHGVPVEKAAEIIVNSLASQKSFQRITIGKWTKMIIFLSNIIPSGLFQRLLAWWYGVRL